MNHKFAKFEFFEAEKSDSKSRKAPKNLPNYLYFFQKLDFAEISRDFRFKFSDPIRKKTTKMFNLRNFSTNKKPERPSLMQKMLFFSAQKFCRSSDPIRDKTTKVSKVFCVLFSKTKPRDFSEAPIRSETKRQGDN